MQLALLIAMAGLDAAPSTRPAETTPAVRWNVADLGAVADGMGVIHGRST
jgi:hypothetical protein